MGGRLGAGLAVMKMNSWFELVVLMVVIAVQAATNANTYSVTGTAEEKSKCDSGCEDDPHVQSCSFWFAPLTWINIHLFAFDRCSGASSWYHQPAGS